MTNENIETIKADAKKVMSDLENIMSHAKADERLMRKKQRLMSRIRWHMQKLMLKRRNLRRRN